MSRAPDHAVTLCVIGALDPATAGLVDGLLCALEGAKFDRLRLDLSGATFVDASGTRLVRRVEQKARLAGWRFSVVPARAGRARGRRAAARRHGCA